MYIVIKDGLKINRLNSDDIKEKYNYRDIEINKNNFEYIITLKNEFCFKEKDKIRVLKCQHYSVLTGKQFGDIDIYVYESNKGFNSFNLYKNEPFILNKNPKSTIVNKDCYLDDYYLLYRENTFESNYDEILLNGRKYNGGTLNDNDIIEFFNFKLIYNKDFLYINNFLIENKMYKHLVEGKEYKCEQLSTTSNNFFDVYNNELIIDDVKEYKPKVLTKSKKLIFQIGPSITMSIAMIGVATLNVYNNLINGNSLLNSLIYIVMPITMLLTGVLWPIISSSNESRNNKKENQKIKKEYIDYLDKYSCELERRIKEFVRKENEYYFDNYVIDKVFYLTNKHSMFLKLSIGQTIIQKKIKFDYTNESDINEKLSLIEKLSSINNIPYFLDTKSYNYISVVSNKNRELIKRYILELSLKNNYEDFYIGIYSDDLNKYSELFSVPSLILGNKRLTLNKLSELQEIVSIKLDRPLVLFSDTRIDFKVTNKDVHLISVVKKEEDILKNSEIAIKYNNTGGIIYSDKETSFYFVNKEINSKEILKRIGRYQKVNFLSKTITFKDVFNDFNIRTYYTNKQKGLRADFGICEEELLSFDLHESKSGPHGLIAGSTGSGKSELIVSMLLSLAIRYRPDYLNIILIDYKGGGIEESLTCYGKRLPHIIASINNLEADIFERLIVSIDHECKRRQKLFKELSNKASTSIMNIDDYLDNNHQKYNLPMISHLLIVVDEFAEMKKENPEIIKELISFSRIGRSLGLHLILATQRPSGVIDDEIWSNSRFKIALRVFSEKDSNDVIKCKEAAYINNPGEFYLQVDESLLKAKSIYSKGDMKNGEPYEVCLLDNKLDIIKKKIIKNNNPITEASYIVGKILETSNELNIKNEEMIFSKPKEKTKRELVNIYGSSDDLTLGEIDDYLNAKKGVLDVDLNENIFIYSTRNNEINNVLNSIRKQCVVIGSKRFKNKYISDSLLYQQQEDISYLFDKLLNEDYDITLVVEDLIALQSFNELLVNDLYQLIRRSDVKKMNMVILSKQSLVNFKLLNCFKNKYAIKIYENQDLINIFSCRSLYKGDSYYHDEQLISFVPIKEEEFYEQEKEYKSIIKYIPDTLSYVKKGDVMLLGFELVSRKEIVLHSNEKLLVTSYEQEIIDKYQKIFKNDMNIEVTLYSKDLLKEERNRVIWIGEGLYSQRIFYIDGKEELKHNEAYYFKGNKGVIMRFITNE